ncbi:metal ABC transporter solute-binding protein, Zn/Mn family [Virgibacillus oceani]
MKALKLLIFISLIGMLAIGCSPSDDASSDTSNGLTIYTTIYPIQYAAERIGGDTVEAESVFPPGVDAHTYEPSTQDMTKIADSDAFIYLGAGMEVFAETSANALASQDVALIELGQQEELFHMENGEGHSGEDHDHDHNGHDHGDHNPHIWIDPLRMLEMAGLIKEEMILLNPEHEELYEENYAALKQDLNELHEEFLAVLVEKENKRLLVSHAAFGYWESRYGIEQISIHGLSTSNEPSQKELTEIINTAEEYNMEYIIFEQNVSTRVSEIIQEQIGAEALVIHNLSVLTDEDIETNENYFSLMEKNLEVLDEATN